MTFFGRQDFLSILSKRICDIKDGYRQNIAMIGDELVGKTSIIHNFLCSFYDPRTIVLYLEIRPESFSAFARRFIAVLLYNFLNNSGMALKEDLGFLMNKSQRYLPRTIEKARDILAAVDKRKKKNMFTELMSLCDLVNQESAKSCVVIMDEFHHLEAMGVKDLYREWARLIITQKTTMYVIMSSMKFKTRTILSKGLSLLFGNFEVLVVEPFDVKTSESYLADRFTGLPVDQGLRDFMVHFTGGYPFYLDVISEAVIAAPAEPLADTLERLLFDASGLLNQRFSIYLKRFLDLPHSQDYISILYLIAKGSNKIRDIASLLRRQKKDLDARINHLLELDAVTRSGDFLKINDRVFSFWIKFVYQEKLRSLTYDAKSQKAAFRDNIESMINEFLVHARKPVPERLLELLRLFSDEMVQIERKRFRLEHFREIKPLQFSGRAIKEGLIGRSHDGIWIVAFNADALTEEDITEFSRECKKYRHKLQKKIIISLKGIDANARLRAMEEKIYTWDIGNLNHLLDLYSRPLVIA